ncbi:TlpA disulfide reductase family protein [Alteromonadaceae bacterium BrNp21-10]|nr:TlpA disulfide reductase family protein [Alteromonadaceae bacterium BrNp21-10]
MFINKLVKTAILLVCSLGLSSAALAASEAADFTLKSSTGDNLRLQELRGNIVLINFWASWCGPCRTELPYLDDLYLEFKDLGFTVLAVNIDEDSSKAAVLLNDMPVSFPVVYDPDGTVSKLYDVQAMPTTVFIDRNGYQRLLHPGYKSGDEVKYRKIVKALIRE